MRGLREIALSSMARTFDALFGQGQFLDTFFGRGPELSRDPLARWLKSTITRMAG